MTLQAPNAVMMIRPHHFKSNPESLNNNVFQVEISLSEETISIRARDEFDTAVNKMCETGIIVHVFDDTSGDTSDSVFPNNWFSTHRERRATVAARLAEAGHDVIALSKAQINNFAGNAIELSRYDRRDPGTIFARAGGADAVAGGNDQGQRLPLLPLDLPTIETAGGSACCMIVGIHLARR